MEDTFERDVTDRAELSRVLHRDAGQVAGRLQAAGLFARTVSIKARRPDFSTLTRSRTLAGATDRADVIARLAAGLLDGVDVTDGIRLLGVGVAGLTDLLQEELFFEAESAEVDVEEQTGSDAAPGPAETDLDPGSLLSTTVPAARVRFTPGLDVVHDRHGPGWVWGSGLGRVTVRFETRDTLPGPVRTFRVDDEALHRL